MGVEMSLKFPMLIPASTKAGGALGGGMPDSVAQCGAKLRHILGTGLRGGGGKRGEWECRSGEPFAETVRDYIR